MRLGSNKDNLPLTDVKTSRKNEYMMSSSPYGSNQKGSYQKGSYDKGSYDKGSYENGRLSTLKFRSPLREQQIQDYNRIKTELKREISIAKQNISLGNSGQWMSMQEYIVLRQDYNVLRQEYMGYRQQTKYQTERLIYEIQKLHQQIYSIQERKNIQIKKIREENEETKWLKMSQLRQGQSSQMQILETQLRKTKQMMNDKTAQNQTLIKRQQREIKQLGSQNIRLNQQVKNLISLKNSELQGQMKVYEQKINNIKKEHQQYVNTVKQTHTKQVNRLSNILQIKETKINTEKSNYQLLQDKCQQLQHTLQRNTYTQHQNRHSLEHQLKQKYNSLKQSLKQQTQSIIQSISMNYQMKEQIYINQINQLKNFILLKNTDRQKLINIHQQRLQFNNQLKQQLQLENNQLKQKLNHIHQQNMQQLEILKVKMASLNQTNIKTLISTYQLKISSLVQQIQQHQSTIQRLTKNLYQQTNHRYQIRKKYSIELSLLNQKIIKLRSGITHIQNDFKQKLQNQKSILLLTSQNLIKDLSTKQNTNKSNTIELHKLQLLYQENYQQLQTSNEIIDQKLKIAEEELHRLTSHVMEQKKRHIETQNTYKNIINNKNTQIQKLQSELNNITHPQFDNQKQIQLINQLKNQLHQEKLSNAQLKDQSQLLQKKINLMKAEIDQYHIEQEITQQQAKKQFQQISKQNMDQFLKFYQAKITTLQNQKHDLKLLISSKQEKITSLVQKYQELQKTMKQTLMKIKKRTELQTKVINLGMDNNLVKNMAEIVKNNFQN